MDRVIWCLWEPPGTLPGYLQACLRTIQRNSGVEVRLLEPADVEALAPDLDPEIARRVPRPGQRSDYYRSHLLAARGGMWLDVDSIVLSSLEFVFDALDDGWTMAARVRAGDSVGTAPLATVPGHPAMRRWIEIQETLIAEHGSELPWTAIGASSLTQAVGTSEFLPLTTEQVAPLPWTQADRFTSRFESPDQVLRGAPPMLNLYNDRFSPALRQMSQDEILGSNLMLGRVLRIALGDTTTADEASWLHRLAPVSRALRKTRRLSAARWRQLRA